MRHVFAGSPASAAGFLVDDQITGVNGAAFVENHEDGYGVAVFGAAGPFGEFGVALDAATGGNGQLRSVLRRRAPPPPALPSMSAEVSPVVLPDLPVELPEVRPHSQRAVDLSPPGPRTPRVTGKAWEATRIHIFAGLALLTMAARQRDHRRETRDLLQIEPTCRSRPTGWTTRNSPPRSIFWNTVARRTMRRC